MIPVLETDRLMLRGLESHDFDAFASFYESDASRFVGGPMDRVASWRHIAACAGSWILRGYGEFAVEDKASGRVAGLVGPWCPEGWPEPEMAWIILPDFQSRGFGLEAARRAMRFAYGELGWKTAISCIAPDNVASIRLAERLGATCEGEAEFKPYGMMPCYRHLPPETFFERFPGRVH